MTGLKFPASEDLWIKDTQNQPSKTMIQQLNEKCILALSLVYRTPVTPEMPFKYYDLIHFL